MAKAPALPEPSASVTTIATAEREQRRRQGRGMHLGQCAADLAAGQAAKSLAEHPPGDHGADQVREAEADPQGGDHLARRERYEARSTFAATLVTIVTTPISAGVLLSCIA